MLLELSTIAGKVGAILATIIYALTLLGQVDRVVIQHLGETFANKQDVQMLKQDVAGVCRKLDAVLDRLGHDADH